jgi:hypothetical protein
MSEQIAFAPPRRNGLAFHLLAIALLLALATAGVWQASRASLGMAFFVALLPFLLALALIPLLAYRAYALWGASYTLQRDSVLLHWGLRLEQLPMHKVLWVHRLADLGQSYPLPLLRWPGAVVGMRRLPGEKKIEYLAARSSQLVLIATQEQLYAISPADPDGFLYTYQRFTELGSLMHLPERSVYPSFLVQRVWNSPPARTALLASLGFSLALVAWVGIVASLRSQVTLGFGADNPPVPAVRLFLLPAVNAIFVLADLLLGLFYYRRGEAGQADGLFEETSRPVTNPLAPEGGKVLAFILWGGGVLTPLLFLAAVFFILRAG